MNNNNTHTMKVLKQLNSKLKYNYDLELAYVGDSKIFYCFLGSWNTKETKDLCFAQDYINNEIHEGGKLEDLVYLPFFK